MILHTKQNLTDFHLEENSNKKYCIFHFVEGIIYTFGFKAVIIVLQETKTKRRML